MNKHIPKTSPKSVVTNEATTMLHDFDGSSIPVTHHFAEVNNTRIHYARAGNGAKLVVLVHGFPQTWWEWRQIIPALAEQYTVIALDVRGMGASDKPFTGYDKKNMSEDIRQLVKQLGFSKAYLVAHDMGVPVTYPYAAQYPNEVEKLVFLDVPPPLSTNPQPWYYDFYQVSDLAETMIRGNERALINYYFRNAAHPERITEEDYRIYEEALKQPGGARGALALWRTFPQDMQDNADLMRRKLPMPVLALHGEKSPLKSFVIDVTKTLAINVKGGSIKDSGHWIAEEQPQALVEEILSFLR